MIAGRCKNLDNRSTKRQELRLYIMRDSTEARCELTGHDLHWSGDNKLYIWATRLPRQSKDVTDHKANTNKKIKIKFLSPLYCLWSMQEEAGKKLSRSKPLAYIHDDRCAT